MSNLKSTLRQIYQALADGTLSQAEALRQIRALKQSSGVSAVDILLARPVWVEAPAAAGSSEAPGFTQHHVLVCGLAKVNLKKLSAGLPGSECTSVAEVPGNVAQCYGEYALRSFERLQGILRSKPVGRVLLQIVGPVGAMLGGLSGLLKSGMQENPQLVGQLIETAGGVSTAELMRQLQSGRAQPQQTWVREVPGRREALRWEVQPQGESGPVVFKDGGVYVITGGLGGLGRLLTREMVERGSAQVIVTGRGEADGESVRGALSALRGQVLRPEAVSYRRLDLQSGAQVREELLSIRAEHGRLDGIVHGAGMIADNFIVKKSAAEFTQVLRPKVEGTYHLDEASREMELDFLVLFGSVAGALGNVGQADYAAANGFMDQYAGYRNGLVESGERRGRTVSIDWPLWADGGMSVEAQSLELLQERTGMRPLTRAAGLQALQDALAAPQAQTLVLAGESSRLRQLLSRSILMTSTNGTTPDAATTGLAAVPEAGEAPHARTLHEKTQDYLRQQFSQLLKLPAHEIDAQAPLEHYGIDSILAMKLTNHLEETFGSMSKTLFFEYRTIHELAAHFVETHAERLTALLAAPPATASAGVADNGDTRITANALVPVAPLIAGRRFARRGAASPAPVPVPVPPLEGRAEAIAVIGLSGRYPESVDLEAYWNNLRDGRDCIVEVPKERWDWREYFTEDRTKTGHHYSKWGGFIAGVDEFDPLFFNISPREAKSIDPQERLFLQHAWMAVEDAGYTRARLQIPHEQGLPGQVGVYVGVMYGEYNLSGSLASIANRVSYVLNLHGPSMTLDTMCSSSLTAIHLACQDLKLGRTDLAIAGGVNVSIHPNKYMMLSAGQFISSDGHCQSFGDGGDGYIPGEGVGAVMLKRLSEAERDGNPIYGIIKGSALNHGGKTHGYTVPNPQAQAGAINHALTEARVDPRHVSYIEAHGTGTKLGDPIEIAALNKAFRQSVRENGVCDIGSAKSNIGHCESAAGIAGLTKVLLQLQHGEIVPSLHSARTNPHIDFEASPFVVNQSLKPWTRPVIDGVAVPRIAGISSFGAGGSNAHVIVEEYVAMGAVADASADRRPVIVPLSARTPEQLEQKVHDLIRFLEKRSAAGASEQVGLASLAYTLQVGREAMEERLGFVAESVDRLLTQLQAFSNGIQEIDEVHRGQVKNNKDGIGLIAQDDDMKEAIEKWIARRKLSKLAELWVKGLEFDWDALHDGDKPRRISLPAYPFAKDRYWVDVTASEPVASGGWPSTGVGTAVLHPLLHTNASTLFQQSYRSTFSGREFFLTDHQLTIDGQPAQKIVPNVAYLEMARAALEQAMPARAKSTILELRDTVWADPVVVTENKHVSLALLANGEDDIGYEIYSRAAGEDIVHCQGRATFIRQAAPPTLDVDQLRMQLGQEVLAPESIYAAFEKMHLHHGPAHRSITAIYLGDGQLLAQLRVPPVVEAGQHDYWLHPSLMDGALQACMVLIEGRSRPSNRPRLPFALDSLHILSPCTSAMMAWVRHAEGDSAEDDVVKLDIDLCDEHGAVCAQMRGLSYHPAVPAADWDEAAGAPEFEPAAAAPTEPAAAAPTTGTARWIALSLPAREAQMRAPRTAAFEAMERRKPEGIALQTPQAVAARGAASMAGGVAGRGESVRLSDLTAAQPVPSEAQRGAQGSGVSLYDLGEGVFSIRLGGTAGNVLSGELIGELLGALERVREEPQLKVLLVEGRGESFARGGRAEQGAAVERGLYRALGGFGYPVIAVMQGDASGAGLLLGAVCDFMVCGEESSYGYTEEWGELYPDSTVEALFAERLGDGRAQELLYRGGRRTGLQLRESGWTCPIVPRGEVQTQGLKLARLLGAKSAQSLRLLKRHLMRPLAGRIEGLERVEERYSERESRVEESGAAWEFASGLELQRQGSTLVVRLGGSEPGSGSMMELGAGVAEMTGLLAQVNASAQCKTVVWVSEAGDFLSSAGAADEGRVRQLQGAVLDCRVPVIAVLAEEARGAAWLLGQCSDACYYRSEGRYGAGFEGFSDGLAGEAAMLGVYRLGRYVGRELALTGAQYTGEQLRRRAGLSTVEPGEQGLAAALGLAQSWSQWSMKTLERWKSGTAREIRERTAALEPFCKIERSEELRSVEAATAVELGSSVVTATVHPGGILVVKLQDRQSKNLFSEAFIAGVSEAFAHVASTPRYKAVILTGYDSYFASGGTKQSLLAIQEGRAKFTDFKIFQLAMECEVPVIAAMQGHGIGAGWSMGMFADLVLFSEESQYVSPYMSYGFTPGAGSTLIVAQQLGHDLARESLLTAQEYTGRELKRRGVRLPVLPREAVPGAALELARQMARGSRSRLMGLKRQLTQPLHGLLEETYRLELAMHEATFVGQSDTLELIKNRFLQSEGAAPEEHRGADGAASFSAGQITAAVSAGAAAGDILAAITATLKKLLAQELHLQETDIEEHVQFVDLGLDSISGVTWIRQINEKYQTTIEATKVYSFPTLAQLSRHVKEQAEQQGTDLNQTLILVPTKIQHTDLPIADSIADTDVMLYSYPSYAVEPSSRAPLASDKPAGAAGAAFLTRAHGVALSHGMGLPATKKLVSWRDPLQPRSASAKYSNAPPQPIAVIGMAGQFPQAKNLEEFWENIAQGRSCITQVPASRWDVKLHYQEGAALPEKSNSRWMGALEEFDLFDPLFFNISPAEAESMEPQQRLFLQTCWQSIENAGHNPHSLSGSKCGVFAGCAGGDYQQLSRKHQLSAQGFTGNAMSILAARISYVLNLQGPCLSIDTACSSALVAIAHACDSLVAGVSDVALAGGVYVMTGPEMHIKTSQAGMLSPDGRCFSFDQRANGFVPGEAVGVVMLKRLADAERDQDTIQALIHGWGVNQDGKTNGITAPNPDSQKRLQQEVYDKYRIDPAGIQLIEAHGTGTQMGDPIEVEGLKQSFKKYTQKKGYCALGSVKSNIGHCLTAAGIAGFIKVVLAMKHRQLPPTINFSSLNEHIGLKDSPFYVNDELREWTAKRGERRQAAVSAFGFSGTNAHMVIGEYQPARVRAPVSVITQRSNHLVPLSARTPTQLRRVAGQLLDFIRRRDAVPPLVEMSYTLQVGREPMGERVGFMAASLDQLETKLAAYLAGEQDDERHEGQVKGNKEGLSIISQDDDMRESIVNGWIAGKQLSKLLALWVRGLEFDWNKLYGDVKPRRVGLPAYPFAKERYWIDAADAVSPATPAATPAVLHPLLHANTSDLRQQRFSSLFSGQESFLVDHPDADGGASSRVLPREACLEMIRAAVERAAPPPSSEVLELQLVAWGEPAVADGTSIDIVLFDSVHRGIGYEIASRRAGSEVIHCQGRASFIPRPTVSVVDLNGLRAGMRAAAAAGIPVVTRVHRGDGQALAELRVPAAEDGVTGLALHPSVMEGVVHAALQATDPHVEGMPVPVSLSSLRVFAACGADMVAWTRHSPSPDSAGARVDIDLCDLEGKVCVEVRGLVVRVLEAAPLADPDRVRAEGVLLARPVWVEAPAAAGSSEAPGFTQHHVLVCGLAKVNLKKLSAGLPGSECTSVAEVPGNVAQCYGEYALRSFERLQGILRSKPVGRVLLQIVGPVGAMLGGLSGLLKSGMQENPQLVGQLIETAGGVSTAELMRQLQSGRAQPQQTWVREVPGRREALRWEVQPQGESGPVVFKDGGVYVITGGLGGLGRLLTREMVERGSAQVIVTGRGEADGESVRGALSALRGQVLRPEAVSYRRLDLQSGAQVREELLSIRAEHGRLDGIVHGAGMIADNFIVKKSAAEFTQVLRPKVEGTYHLDEASREMELDFLVLFGSVAGALGNVGQADYAAANGFMDQYAGYRNGLVESGERRGRTVSIDWPLWADGGMSVEAQSLELLQERTGMRPLTRAAGLQALQDALAAPQAQTLVLAGELALLERLLSATPAAGPAAGPAAAGTGEPFLAQPRISPASSGMPSLGEHAARQLQEKTLQKLKLLLGRVIKLSPAQIDENEDHASYGIDSMMIMKLNQQLQIVFGEISKTLFFEYSTLHKLAMHLVAQHPLECAAWTGVGGRNPARGEAALRQRVAASSADSWERLTSKREMRSPSTFQAPSHERRQPIAIIGMSGIYPQAPTLEDFWYNLKTGRTSITEIPADRWALEGFYEPDETRAVDEGKSYCKWGGFIDQFSEFDPLFFGMSPREALNKDPQERLFLQAAWQALENSGYTRLDLQQKFEREVGVFAGVTKAGFNLYGTRASHAQDKFHPHTSFSSVANRVSYFMDITGPSMPIDTMCSSSLTAIHEACEHIHRGECRLAFAGGVNLYLHPSTYVDMATQHVLSRDGLCRSFGAGANGFVPGEGVGVVLLKPLAAAMADKDQIHGVILATHVNHGGKTNGYTVPNPAAQADLIRRTIDKAGISARAISYIEAHGTGTELGDPIEIEGLQQAIRHDTPDIGYCKIGSAKSNIGHLEAAAGIAGLTKILLQMKHGEIAPSLHADVINPNIRLDVSPFVLNRTLTPWHVADAQGNNLPRIAGISSFGAGGANAHVIVQEYLAAVPPVEGDAGGPVIVPLSARTVEQLRQRAGDLLDFLQSDAAGESKSVDLARLAYTLQVGREAMDARLGIIANSIDDLREKLRAYLDGEYSEETFQGQVRRLQGGLAVFGQDEDLQEAVDKWMRRKKLPKLTDLWVNGLKMDWRKLHAGVEPQRIALPVYPFARERYWMERTPSAQIVHEAAPRDFSSIEDILDRIDADTMDAGDAVRLLNTLC